MQSTSAPISGRSASCCTRCSPARDPSAAIHRERSTPAARRDRPPQRIPRRVQKLLKSCLAADPRNRLRDIGDFRLLLEEEPASGKAGAPTRRALAAALVGAATATALGAWGWLRSPASPREAARASALYRDAAGGDSRVYREAVVAPSLALSPDGLSLVIAATGSEGHRLYVRKIDELAATPLAGTSGATSPFFSPDGAWIGFFADGRLRRVPAEGGAAVDIAEAVGAAVGASWGEDGRIVFAFGWRSPLWAVPASGGRAEIIAPLDPERGETYMRQPELTSRRTRRLARAAVEGRECRRRDRPSERTARDAHRRQRAAFTPKAATCSSLEARRCWPHRSMRKCSPSLGPLVPLVEGIAFDAGGTLHYAVSPSGTLAYVPGAERSCLGARRSRGRGAAAFSMSRPRFHRPRFAPDGKTLAVAVARGAEHTGDDIWLYDLASSGPGRRLTFEGGTSPDLGAGRSLYRICRGRVLDETDNHPASTRRMPTAAAPSSACSSSVSSTARSPGLRRGSYSSSRPTTALSGSSSSRAVSGAVSSRDKRASVAGPALARVLFGYFRTRRGVTLTAVPRGRRSLASGRRQRPHLVPGCRTSCSTSRDDHAHGGEARHQRRSARRIAARCSELVRDGPCTVTTTSRRTAASFAFIRSTDPVQGRRSCVAFDWLADLGRAPRA